MTDDTFLLMRRRTLLAGLAAAPLLVSAGRAGAQSLGDLRLQEWLAARAGSADPVIIPASRLPLSITGPVFVPKGMNLVIRRDLVGTPKAELVLSGTTSIRFEGSRVTDVPLRLTGGTISISGFDYRGYLHSAAIMIQGAGPYRDLRIEDFKVSDANFGILRHGHGSSLTGAVIRRGRFARLRGDAIEWNVCPRDTGVLVEDHEIDGIDDPLGRPNWGIGIGFAGAKYDQGWDRAVSVKKFTIRNIRGRSLRQLIHVEAGTDFTIEQIVGHDISDRYSAKSGMPSAAVCCYGCSDFNVSGVTADSGSILLFAGALHNIYIVPSTNFTLSDVKLAKGDIQTEMGGANSFGRFRRIDLAAGSMRLNGAVANLELTDVAVRSARGKKPILENPDFLSGPLTRFRPKAPNSKRTRLTLRPGV
ncbi:MAG: wcaM [Sphingomonas bacterium]|nr:wcaM [Sphingomonas bacterium]